jgi:hypothetical protein
MKERPRIDHYPDVARDREHAKHDDVERLPDRVLRPLCFFHVIQADDRIRVDRVLIVARERRELDPELVPIDQSDQAPTVEPGLVPPAVEERDSDIPIRPPGSRH